METKRIRIELEEVKVVNILLDLGDDLQNYMSKFLSLKNHERETREILEVRNFYGSNHVSVTMLIDELKDETKWVERCKDWAGQFGEFIGEAEVDTAFLLDKDANCIDSELDWKEMYIY